MHDGDSGCICLEGTFFTSACNAAPVVPVSVIVIYRSSGCNICAQATDNVRLILAELGIDYDEVVLERIVGEGSAEIEELRQINLYGVPVIKIGDKVLVQSDTLSAWKVREFVQECLKGMVMVPHALGER
ncbi:hypothetical protein ABH15_12185 [Methanoculleus taiwanensis]|uniref:Uncharacterized protein n=1 Tax=Methanoculleus taiwanensis TaxID=1550565 RepID=A0A498H0A0_9EURY|nr:hypothetical protein ABH15_12185 [Methanoculleus taiwanensis]